MSRPKDPPAAAGQVQSVALLDWNALRLLNQYRILLIAILGAVFYLVSGQQSLGTHNSTLFQFTLWCYLGVTLLFKLLSSLQRPHIRTQFFLQHYLDILLITVMMHASGGIQSGLGTLLVLCIALLSLMANARYALLFAAIATVILMAESLYTISVQGLWAVDLQHVAILCLMLFAVAWLLSVPLRHLSQRTLWAGNENRVSLESADIATLNEAIIREFDSGVLVVDGENRVVVMNAMARTLLGVDAMPLPIHLAYLCPELDTDLRRARERRNFQSHPFTLEQSRQEVLPRYIPLGQHSLLIRLDDHAAIRAQFQQIKLASLGRLSASIAHEIRNPLSAITQALQLLEENDSLAEQDQRLLAIALNNSQRINRIVQDILQLSNRQTVQKDALDISAQLSEFVDRFRATHSNEVVNILADVELALIGHFDPTHLDQVLWNLCNNAVFHNQPNPVQLRLQAWSDDNQEVVIDVIDDGCGISAVEQDRLFEPFYSTHHDGCGLGLYIIRELCELNQARIEILDNDNGAHFQIRLPCRARMAA